MFDFLSQRTAVRMDRSVEPVNQGCPYLWHYLFQEIRKPGVGSHVGSLSEGMTGQIIKSQETYTPCVQYLFRLPVTSGCYQYNSYSTGFQSSLPASLQAKTLRIPSRAKLFTWSFRIHNEAALSGLICFSPLHAITPPLLIPSKTGESSHIHKILVRIACPRDRSMLGQRESLHDISLLRSFRTSMSTSTHHSHS